MAYRTVCLTGPAVGMATVPPDRSGLKKVENARLAELTDWFDAIAPEVLNRDEVHLRAIARAELRRREELAPNPDLAGQSPNNSPEDTFAHSTYFSTLPVDVFGSCSKSTCLGHLKWAMRSRTNSISSPSVAC